jgi:hypothetical protein
MEQAPRAYNPRRLLFLSAETRDRYQRGNGKRGAWQLVETEELLATVRPSILTHAWPEQPELPAFTTSARWVPVPLNCWVWVVPSEVAEVKTSITPLQFSALARDTTWPSLMVTRAEVTQAAVLFAVAGGAAGVAACTGPRVAIVRASVATNPRKPFFITFLLLLSLPQFG